MLFVFAIGFHARIDFTHDKQKMVEGEEEYVTLFAGQTQRPKSDWLIGTERIHWMCQHAEQLKRNKEAAIDKFQQHHTDATQAAKRNADTQLDRAEAVLRSMQASDPNFWREMCNESRQPEPVMSQQEWQQGGVGRTFLEQQRQKTEAQYCQHRDMSQNAPEKSWRDDYKFLATHHHYQLQCIDQLRRQFLPSEPKQKKKSPLSRHKKTSHKKRKREHQPQEEKKYTPPDQKQKPLLPKKFQPTDESLNETKKLGRPRTQLQFAVEGDDEYDHQPIDEHGMEGCDFIGGYVPSEQWETFAHLQYTQHKWQHLLARFLDQLGLHADGLNKGKPPFPFRTWPSAMCDGQVREKKRKEECMKAARRLLDREKQVRKLNKAQRAH